MPQHCDGSSGGLEQVHLRKLAVPPGRPGVELPGPLHNGGKHSPRHEVQADGGFMPQLRGGSSGGREQVHLRSLAVPLEGPRSSDHGPCTTEACMTHGM